MIQIVKKENCCGCSACSQCCPVNAICMEADDQGFLYPVVNKDICIECGKCERVCPIINNMPEEIVAQRAFLLQHLDGKILKDSSSGGAFTAIAEQIIKKGGVVFGAAYSQDFQVLHTYVDNLQDLRIFRNSKYVQSDIRESYKYVKRFLIEGRWVCFSGTPCQIEGLVRFLGGRPEKLLLVDVVCHAVPSPAVWKTFLEIQTDRGIKRIRNMRFRDKAKYGYLYSQFVVETTEGRIYQGIETNEMLRAFFSEICNRPSCYACKFKKRYRQSDITIWDCFDVDEFTNNKQFKQDLGVSRVITHSDKGVRILNGCRNTCLIQRITPDNALHFDAREMTQSVEKNPKYDAFWQSFSRDRKKTITSFFPQRKVNVLEGMIRKIMMKIGLYRLLRKTYKRLFGNRQR